MRADDELVIGMLRSISVATVVLHADRLVPVVDQAAANIERVGRALLLGRMARALQARVDQVERAEAIYWQG